MRAPEIVADLIRQEFGDDVDVTPTAMRERRLIFYDPVSSEVLKRAVKEGKIGRRPAADLVRGERKTANVASILKETRANRMHDEQIAMLPAVVAAKRRLADEVAKLIGKNAQKKTPKPQPIAEVTGVLIEGVGEASYLGARTEVQVFGGYFRLKKLGPADDSTVYDPQAPTTRTSWIVDVAAAVNQLPSEQRVLVTIDEVEVLEPAHCPVCDGTVFYVVGGCVRCQTLRDITAKLEQEVETPMIERHKRDFDLAVAPFTEMGPVRDVAVMQARSRMDRAISKDTNDWVNSQAKSVEATRQRRAAAVNDPRYSTGTYLRAMNLCRPRQRIVLTTPNGKLDIVLWERLESPIGRVCEGRSRSPGREHGRHPAGSAWSGRLEPLPAALRQAVHRAIKGLLGPHGAPKPSTASVEAEPEPEDHAGFIEVLTSNDATSDATAGELSNEPKPEPTIGEPSSKSVGGPAPVLEPAPDGAVNVVQFSANRSELAEALRTVQLVGRPRHATNGRSGCLVVIEDGLGTISSRNATTWDVAAARFPVRTSSVTRGGSPIRRSMCCRYGSRRNEAAVSCRIQGYTLGDDHLVRQSTSDGASAIHATRAPGSFAPIEAHLTNLTNRRRFRTSILREAITMAKPFTLDDGANATEKRKHRRLAAFKCLRIYDSAAGKADGTLYATNGYQHFYFYCDDFRGKSAEIPRAQIRPLAAFLRRCGPEVDLHDAPGMALATSKDWFHVFGWAKHTKPPLECKILPKNWDKVVLLVTDRAKLVEQLNFIKSELPKGHDKIEIEYKPEHEPGQLRFRFVAAGKTTSLQTDVVVAHCDLPEARLPDGIHGFANDVSVKQMLGLFQDVKAKVVEFRMFLMEEHGGPKGGAGFRTVDEFLLDKEGKVVGGSGAIPDPANGVYQCKVTRFMPSCV